ncbi:MAG: hypothetical protein JWQ44_2962 [Chthoniobacter sp.]|nr:hypothetical protein [Chthoniobacter sp.]
MTTSKAISKNGAAGPWAAQPPRMRGALAKAIDLIATKGKTQNQAAEMVGMHYTSLSRALAKPEVRAYLDARKAQYSLDADALRGVARSLAIHVGIDLMNTAQSEAVKAKMVEFFAGEGRQPLVNVSINGPAPSAYTFTKPDHIDATPDMPSGVEDAQVVDNKEQSDDV